MRGRIGVFLCHCGLNIAGSVDVERVVREISRWPGVVHAEHYIYRCSDPGQELVRKAIREKGLDAIVMANCSPALHQRTFRDLAASEGLNPYLCEIANIREWCSWPHWHEPERATEKALEIVKAAVEKVRRNMALEAIKVPLTRRALVIGGGVAGLEAALDIAEGGFEVHLVERAPYLGGKVVGLSSSHPALLPGGCDVIPMALEAVLHPRLRIHLLTEVEAVEGYVGNFKVKLRGRPPFVDWERCTGCGICQEVCPVEVPSEFDRGLSKRRAIYIPHRRAVPQRALIDPESCLRFEGKPCDLCLEACPEEAVDFSQGETFEEVEVGAIVVATGYDLYPKEAIGEYDPDPDVIDALEFERILAPDGPTGGEVRRPSDGRVPKEVVFVQCVGSRDPDHHLPYCSKVCCMYTAKEALLYKERVPEGRAYVFYMDVRATGKGHEEFIQEATSRGRILYLRGRVARIFREGEKLKVIGIDTLSDRTLEVEADLVVLAMGLKGAEGVRELAKRINVLADSYGLLSESHPKLGPVETLTAGVYLAGCAQFPKEIQDSISQASAASSKVISLFSQEELLHSPEVARVDQEVCSGCGYCERVCAYGAVEVDRRRKVAVVKEVLCEGCGACAAACPSGAAQLVNSTYRQVMEMVGIFSGGNGSLEDEGWRKAS